MGTIIQHAFGGTTALVLVGEATAASKPKKRTTARRAPGIAERIECLKAGAAACRQLAAGAHTKDSHKLMIERAEKWERRAVRLAEKVRGRQQPGELFTEAQAR